jgi:hypothetical protein
VKAPGIQKFTRPKGLRSILSLLLILQFLSTLKELHRNKYTKLSLPESTQKEQHQKKYTERSTAKKNLKPKTRKEHTRRQKEHTCNCVSSVRLGAADQRLYCYLLCCCDVRSYRSSQLRGKCTCLLGSACYNRILCNLAYVATHPLSCSAN